MNKQLRDRLRIPPNPLRLSEVQMQRAIFAELRLREQEFPQLRYVIHVPNEGKRSAVGGALAKAGGLQPGVLDMTSLIGPRWALELKAGDNVPTSEQSWWMQRLADNGQMIGLAYSIDEAIEFILDAIQLPGPHRGKNPAAASRAIRWLSRLEESGAELPDPRNSTELKTRAW